MYHFKMHHILNLLDLYIGIRMKSGNYADVAT